MINIDFINGITENITVVLANRNLDKQGKILNVSDFVYSGKLNEADEISFNVYKFLGNKEEKLWQYLQDNFDTKNLLDVMEELEDFDVDNLEEE